METEHLCPSLALLRCGLVSKTALVQFKKVPATAAWERQVKRQQYLRHRLQTLSALRDAVGAMRSLSAHHFRRARQALQAARQYRDEMDTIIAEIGIHQPLHVEVPAGILVIASDLGLCGDYNSRLSQWAIAEARSHAAPTVYSVGHRASRRPGKKRTDSRFAATMRRRAWRVCRKSATGPRARRLDDYLSRRIGSLHVVSAGFEGVGHFTPLSIRVLPIEPAAGARPLRRSPYAKSGHLATVAVREFLYITLYEILAGCFGGGTRDASDRRRSRA